MISIRNVSKNFGSLKVLEDISVEISQGDIFGIIGQSGAGKSTLLRCINGLEDYQQGSIWVEGKEISSLSKKELQNTQREMGMIFQNFNLLSRLNVYDNIALPLQFWRQNKNSQENRQRIQELLKLVGLEDKVRNFPRQLSGGQMQRVAIARALVLNPKILLCDEATSALDPRITRDILSLLMEINKNLGITIVVVTHQMEVVKQICNQVVFIKDGRNVAAGRPEDLFVAPNKEIRSFAGANIECLPKTGRNIQLFFNSGNSENSLITKMARELDIDFSICQGKLEDFRGSFLGSLVINVQPEDEMRVLKFLDDCHVLWEVI